MAENRTETLVSTKNQNEAEAVMDFLATLDQNEKKDFLVFMQGIKFAKNLNPQSQAV